MVWLVLRNRICCSTMTMKTLVWPKKWKFSFWQGIPMLWFLRIGKCLNLCCCWLKWMPTMILLLFGVLLLVLVKCMHNLLERNNNNKKENPFWLCVVWFQCMSWLQKLTCSESTSDLMCIEIGLTCFEVWNLLVNSDKENPCFA